MYPEGERWFGTPGYVSDGEDAPLQPSKLQRGYEVAPGKLGVVDSDELRLRQPASTAMEIVKSVRRDESYPVFFETSRADAPMRRPARPEGIAPAYVFLTPPQCSSYITGEVLPIIGGYSGG